MAPRRSKPLWSFVVALLLAAQLALGFHQLSHRLAPEFVTNDQCALCHFASAMVDGPKSVIVAPRAFAFFDWVIPADQTFLPPAGRVAGFLSRAPPLSLSV